METLYQGARNAVKVCMGVRPGERVLIITDKNQNEVGNALGKEAEKITPNNVKVFVLEDYGKRPMTQLPKEIISIVPWANVTFFVADSKPEEVSMRRQFRNAAVKYARHAHMPGVTRQVMEEGMCADYTQIFQLTKRLYKIVKDCRKARVTNPLGTILDVEFATDREWVMSYGIYHQQGEWGNLPDGELFTAPKKVNGRMVVDLLGDWFCEKYGILTETPVFIDVEDSRANLRTLECSKSDLERDLLDYLQTDENSNRFGEFACGTNIFLKKLIGNYIQDEKLVTVHGAFGNPYPELTGVDWESKTHIDCIMKDCSVWIDGKKIMERGKYLFLS